MSNDVLELAYRVAHDYPGGIPALAQRLAINAGTLQNRLNPQQEESRLGLAEAVAITLATNDSRILKAFAAACGHVAIPMPDLRRVSDTALLDLLFKRDKEMGEFAQAVAEALKDGDVTPQEMKGIRREGMEAVGAMLELINRLEGLVRGREETTAG